MYSYIALIRTCDKDSDKFHFLKWCLTGFYPINTAWWMFIHSKPYVSQTCNVIDLGWLKPYKSNCHSYLFILFYFINTIINGVDSLICNNQSSLQVLLLFLPTITITTSPFTTPTNTTSNATTTATNITTITLLLEAFLSLSFI